MASPAIIVATSVDSGEPMLGGAIESVQAETFAQLGFLILDDGSTDQSREMIAHVARNENRGDWPQWAARPAMAQAV